LFTTLGAFRNATRQDLNSRLLQGRPAVMRSGRAVAEVRDLTGRGRADPCRIAAIVDRLTGARHLGAWVD